MHINNINLFRFIIEKWRNPNKVIVVTIGGFPGSGKTTLAKYLNKHVTNCETISTDWFSGQNLNKKSLSEIIENLKKGKNCILKEYYNPESGLCKEPRLLKGLRTGGIIFIEGVYVMDTDFKIEVDFRIVLQTPLILSTRQYLRRQNGKLYISDKSKNIYHQEQALWLTLCKRIPQFLALVNSLMRAYHIYRLKADICLPNKLVSGSEGFVASSGSTPVVPI